MKNEIFDQMPVLHQLARHMAKYKPLEGVTVGACLHITRQTAGLLMALQAGGASVYLAASNPLSTQDEVADTLAQMGIKNLSRRGESMEDYQNNLEWVVENQPDLIIDDGGDLTTLCHGLGHYPKYGGLEETTTGIQRLKMMKLLFPMIAVNDTPTKHLFDNVYGTGQSVIDGILRATDRLLAGKTFVVAGYGHCGKGLAQRAKGMGCQVIVTEIDPVAGLQAHMDGFQVMTMEEASYRGEIFVTVTGNTDVITRKHMKFMNPGTILANAGHFDVEIDVEAVKDFPHLTLLGEGRLVNLVCAEGHPSEVMDMSFSNQALCAVYLRERIDQLHPQIYQVPGFIDRYIAREKIKSLGLAIDKLTEKQFNYIHS